MSKSNPNPLVLSLLLSAGLLFAALVVRRWATARKSRAPPRPPGPKGLPFVGNLLQLPYTHLWEQVSLWGEEFGDMVYIEIIGKPMLFLNSYDDAVELLSNRSAIYSSRPHSVMGMELERWDWLTLHMPYGETFRKHRAFHHRFINSPDILNYLDVQLNETRKILGDILIKPGEYGEHINHLPGKVVMMNVYGHQAEKDDRYINLGKNSVRVASHASEQYFFLDVMPWLKRIPEWTPFVKFHRVAKVARKISHAMRFELYELTKNRIAEGTARECMTSMFLSENKNEDGTINDEEDFCAASATLFVGAVDTTTTAIMTFVLAMLKNPEAQRLAQLEIDQVVGTERLPRFEDKENLPYVQAICAEVLRFATITPFTLPHYTTTEDEYKGYHITAGTTVFANIWEMGKSPRLNDDPFVFKPERWLSYGGKEGDLRGPHPRDFSFGFGRRICPGQKWAESLLFITAASMLAAFNIEKAISENGETIEPISDFLQAFVRTLGPSKCKITPRSEKMAALIRLSAEDN